MNKIYYYLNSSTTLLFTDNNETNENGKIVEGSFYNDTSLLEDELSIDTIDVRVRYEATSPSL